MKLLFALLYAAGIIMPGLHAINADLLAVNRDHLKAVTTMESKAMTKSNTCEKVVHLENDDNQPVKNEYKCASNESEKNEALFVSKVTLPMMLVIE